MGGSWTTTRPRRSTGPPARRSTGGTARRGRCPALDDAAGRDRRRGHPLGHRDVEPAGAGPRLGGGARARRTSRTIVDGSHVEHAKPAPDLLLLAAERLGVRAGALLGGRRFDVGHPRGRRGRHDRRSA